MCPNQTSIQESTDPEHLSRGSNAFGNSLFSHLNTQEGDNNGVFLSPWGVSHILAMLLEGAAPNSLCYQQLITALFSGTASIHTLDDVRASMQLLTTSLTASSDDDELTVSDASSAWVKPEFQLSASYVDALKTYYNAQARPMTSAQVVNLWVEEQTRGKIDSIITEKQFRMATLALVNVIYFKGKWLEPFKKLNTMRQIFTLGSGLQMDTQMMYAHLETSSDTQAAKFKAPLSSNTDSSKSNSIDCIAVKMPYKGGAYSAIVAMPEGNTSSHLQPPGLTLENGTDYLSALSACRQAVISGLSPIAGTTSSIDDDPRGIPWQRIGSPGMYGIHLYLPRFEIEFDINLNAALKAAGVGAIFEYGDLTKMTAAGDMEVSEVIQKLYVKVDEAGTEAAVVTAAFLGPGCCCGPPPPPELTVRFDKPFVFAIIHEESGMVLFIGEVYKPEEWIDFDYMKYTSLRSGLISIT